MSAKGFTALVAIGAAVFLICYSTSAIAISSFKHDVYDLLKPFSPPKEAIEPYLLFAEKVVGLTFALLAIALIASFLALWAEVKVGRWWSWLRTPR